jgi:glycosyltransferase involved in cell wall biosynthesis
MVPLSLPRAAVALLRRGLSAHPLQVAIHESRLMRRAIRAARETEAFDVAHVQLVRMAPYLDDIRPLPHVVDLVDALSLNMERRARHDRGVGRWLARLEGRRLGRYERTVCDAVDRALVGSATDRQALGSPPKLAVVTSGVDLTEFPRQHGGREPATVIFAGNMGYFPNVLAARWLGGTILPTVAREVPGVRLRIVGARPDPEVLSMARRDARITVVAGPEHIAPHLGRAAVAVAPMQAGSGQQLKVLEAMASGTPVVATTIAAGGVEARHGEHLLVADEPEAFAAHVVRLLIEPMLAAGLADRARGLVESRYTWDRSVAELERIYESVIDEHDNR